GNLVDGSGQPAHRLLNVLNRTVEGMLRAHRCTLTIIGGRRKSQSNLTRVFLGRSGEKLSDPSGFSDAERQYASCHGIQRSKMTPSAGPEHAAYVLHDIMGCHTLRFVDYKYAIHGSDSPCAYCRGSPGFSASELICSSSSSRRKSFSTVSSYSK